MKALLIQLRVIDREQGLKVNTNDMAKIRSMLPQLHEAEKRRKEEAVKDKEDEPCAVEGSFKGNGHKYKE